ncbi:anti-repressor SinI family protein [Bacillus marinisedimentorum]|uniref:anti-repressor SinI family protein n=1 Tax=Bacillus marinisedimentorum TaxID=1821260 RepID=UPI0007DFCF90|nr:anti-repressor SinI family protein [Bacillus marinisedimentorum]
MAHIFVLNDEKQSFDHEWADLMRKAKEMGFTADEIRNFLLHNGPHSDSPQEPLHYVSKGAVPGGQPEEALQ